MTCSDADEPTQFGRATSRWGARNVGIFFCAVRRWSPWPEVTRPQAADRTAGPTRTLSSGVVSGRGSPGAHVSVCRVLVVDDHPMFRRGIATGLEGFADITVAGECEDAVQAAGIVGAGTVAADVVLIDLDLSGQSAIPAASQIIAVGRMSSRPAPRVLFMGAEVTPELLVSALLAGGSGCVSKRLTHCQLRRSLRLVHEGAFVLSPEAAAVLRSALTRDDRGGPPFSHLTEREREVLTLVARGHDNRRIARELCLSEKTVRNHVTRLFAKLQANRRAEVVALARDAGLA